MRMPPSQVDPFPATHSGNHHHTIADPQTTNHHTIADTDNHHHTIADPQTTNHHTIADTDNHHHTIADPQTTNHHHTITDPPLAPQHTDTATTTLTMRPHTRDHATNWRQRATKRTSRRCHEPVL
jgi:hypothetical protein